MPPITNVGFIAGPVLVAIAARVTGEPTTATPEHPHGRAAAWAHLLLPYLPLVGIGVLILVQQLRGRHVDTLTMYLGLLVVGLVVIRQMITLIDNTVLGGTK